MRSHTELKNRIKYFRELAGLSQTELALRCGLTQNTISAFETGRYCPTALNAGIICRVLGRRFDDVFYLQEDSNG